MTEDATPVSEYVARIGLVGHGWLYNAVSDAVRQKYWVAALSEPAPANVDAVLFVSDSWDRELHVRWNDVCLERGIPLLPAYLEPGAAIVGPGVLPWKTGCLVCAVNRRLRARHDGGSYAEVLNRFAAEMSTVGQMWLTPFAVDVVCAFAVAEISHVVGAQQAMETRNAFLRLELDTLRSSVHRFLPDSVCERCGQLPHDTPQAATLETKPRPKVSPNTYRAGSLNEKRQHLFDRYVDSQAGLLRGVHKEGRNVFSSATAPLGVRGTYRTERGFGQHLDYDKAQLTAIAEGLERYGGSDPAGKRTVVRGSYHELREQALDPTSLGLHSEQQYARPDSPYVRYHHDLALNWVWGYSFRSQQPILVPENYAYYGTIYQNPLEQPFVYEISNGCALGGCLEEAILYGILEIAERDSFLMTWYARLPVPTVDPYSATDRSIPLIVDSIEHSTSFSIQIHNTTVEHGVPCFWVMAVDEHSPTAMPKLRCAGGSHLDPEKAVARTLMELAPMLSSPAEYYQRNRERALAMLADPDTLVHMEDHALLNSVPEAFHRFDFLRSDSTSHTFEQAFPAFYSTQRNEDLLEDLNDTLEQYLTTGLDVIVVDQTTPEQRVGGFRCVKVIIPGCLPMTFGHYARRVTGLNRLYRVPFELGYYDRPLTDADINPHPHPFP